MRFDSNSPRGPAHASGTEFYPVLRLIELPSILGRIIVNFPIFRSKNRKFNMDTRSSTGLKQGQCQVDASSYLNRPCY